MSDELRVRQGEVWQVRLDPVEGSEQGGTRPVLVLSDDALNESLPVVTVASITSRKLDRIYRTEVMLPAPEGGLRRDGKVMLYQLRTVSKSRMQSKRGTVSQLTLQQCMAALRVVFGM